MSSRGDGLDSYDIEAVNNSVLNILLIKRGTIPFNIQFGAGLSTYIFEPMDMSSLNEYMSKILDMLEFYESRITIDRGQVEVSLSLEEQSVDIYLPYTINATGVEGEFYKRLVLG